VEDAVARLTALLARPECMRLRALDLRPGWAGRPRGFDVAHVQNLVENLPLRWLGLGCASELLDVGAVPSLRGLALASSQLEVSDFGDARDIEVDLGAFGLANDDGADAGKAIAALAALPLERLVIANAPAASVVERFERMPTLRVLGLVGGDDTFNDAFIERLVQSPLLPELTAIGFSVQRYEQSNRRIVENAAKLSHVKLFTAPRWEGGWIHAWHDLAHLYETLGRTEDALVEFDALVTIDDDATYLADIGFQLAKLERREEALAAHDHAIERDPKCSRAWSGRACLLEDEERFAEAIIAWDAAQAAGLADVHTWTHRAWTLMRLDRNEEALVALDAALSIDPQHAWSLENRKKLRSPVAKAKRGLSKLWRRA
jgi:tetratricopeptide (TPR) repeat protein